MLCKILLIHICCSKHCFISIVNSFNNIYQLLYKKLNHIVISLFIHTNFTVYSNSVFQFLFATVHPN